MGYISAGEYDPNTGIWEYIPDPGFTQQNRKAIAEFIVPLVCDVVGKMESGYRAIGFPALANRAAVSRQNASCYTGPPPSYVATENPNKISGGQCDALYVGEIDIRTQNNSSFTFSILPAGIQGPVRDIIPISGGTGSYKCDYLREGVSGRIPVPGGGSSPSLNKTLEVLAARLVKADGSTDECGDLPGDPPSYPDGVELPPPPAPGDVVAAGDIVTVNIDVAGSPTDVSVTIGDLVFNVDEGLTFEVDGMPAKITPDLDLQIDPFGCSPCETALAVAAGIQSAEIEFLRLQLNCVIDQVCSVKLNQLSSVDCQGNISNYSAVGESTDVILDSIGYLSTQINAQTSSLCVIDENPPDNVAPFVLQSYSVDLSNEAGVELGLVNDVSYLNVVITGMEGKNKTYKGIGFDDEQGRFGDIFFGRLSGVRKFWWPSVPLWRRRSLIKVQRIGGEAVFVRVSSFTGFSVEISDSGIRV